MRFVVVRCFLFLKSAPWLGHIRQTPKKIITVCFTNGQGRRTITTSRLNVSYMFAYSKRFLKVYDIFLLEFAQ